MVQKGKDGRFTVSISPHNEFNWSVFDHIYCFSYLPYFDRRGDITRELDSVGILGRDNFSFYYTVPNKYYDLLFYGNQDFMSSPDVNITNVNYTINSYNMLKNAYDLGYDRILVLEDDIRFLKDKKLFFEYLSDMPSGYDLVMFEYFVWSRDRDFKSAYGRLLGNEINSHYLYFSTETVFDTGMFTLSRRMIKHMIDCDEMRLKPFDGYTRFQNTKDDSTLKRAISRIPLCIQKEYAARQEESETIDKYPMFDREAYEI